ncbi:MAG: DUF975 family protein [Firmicutes bacterium]|nr:DUF975 family protein [Bacillota bacterium]
MDLKKLKHNALLHLKLNWPNAIFGALISIVLWSLVVLRFFEVGSVLLLFILFMPFMVGISRYHYSLSYPKKANIKEFLYGFHERTYLRSLGGLALKYFYLFWWTLFFIVPGIYKAISYAMTTYILQDPDFSHLNDFQVISKSKQMMNGHKTEYFILMLSFLPWFLLSVLSAGIGLFFTLPYYEQAKAEFYRELEKDIF